MGVRSSKERKVGKESLWGRLKGDQDVSLQPLIPLKKIDGNEKVFG
jgi:hypothetical protein